MKLENTFRDTVDSEKLNKALTDTMSNIKDKEERQQQSEDASVDSALDDIFGEEVQSTENKDNTTKEKPKPKIRFGVLLPEDRELACRMNLVPVGYKEARFDKQRIIDNIQDHYKRTNALYYTYDLDEYIDTCVKILNSIRLGKLPPRSYVIGAPNGFGKTSFVNECIMTLNKNCYVVTPYISLYELGVTRKIDSDILLKPYSYDVYKREIAEDREKRAELEREYLTKGVIPNMKGNYHIEPRFNKGRIVKGDPKEVCGRYSYSEYINADCVFVDLSGIMSKDVESRELYQLLSIRGKKGLPTIVTVSTSMDYYYADVVLREQIWDEIMCQDENTDLYDRLYHVSCYRQKITSRVDNIDLVVDKANGIVYKRRGD